MSEGGSGIRLLLETGDVLAVEKPEGLASIPERDRDRRSLLHLLQESRGERLFVVHRLDKEVSGVILFARTAAAHKLLNDQFAERLVRKSYVAVVQGIIDGPGGTVDKPLRQFGSGRVGVDESGKGAETDFDVEERWPAATLLKVRPRTGRRHQIRVHLYAIGHPILGDLRYGNRELQAAFPRLMLHAERITFVERSGLRRTVLSEPAESFRAVCEALRAGSLPPRAERT